MEGDWKRSVGFNINYESGQSSDDEFPGDVVVRRKPLLVRSSELLEDGGDGAPADLLGTTPPRTIRKDKEKRRACIDAGGSNPLRVLKNGMRRRQTVDIFYKSEQPHEIPERMKKRSSVKITRARDRDWKDTQYRDTRADSLPSPGEMPALPTLVESCNRFMCLTSKLKCKSDIEGNTIESTNEELPQSRLDFHRTFSMLINMGNVEKGCRRTISREEQVWQNELKDLIWLEIQAKLAGRTLEQQDDYLCEQRKIVPIVIKNIVDYRFVNNTRCESSTKQEVKSELTAEETDEDYFDSECISFTCEICADTVGRALREVSTLLDSYYNAVSLYPSWKAMTQDHPLIATHLFKNRLKAMCLWYNIVMHLRLKLLAVKNLIMCMKEKEKDKEIQAEGYASESDIRKPRFEIASELSASSSNNSDVSAAGPLRTVRETTSDMCDSSASSEKPSYPTTPEVIISETTSTQDTTISNESGYASERDGGIPTSETKHNVFNMGSLHDIASMRLMNKEQVSPYRHYHLEVLKTQGVRRSMMFIDKLRNSTLRKVHMTFEKPDQCWEESSNREDGGEMFEDITKETDDNTHLFKEAYELRRYGCRSRECVAMRLPSYRPQFLLLSTICLEAIHDYLTLRRETRPLNPSCLTVKQIIHELKEALDIAADMRALYVRDIKVTRSNAEHVRMVLKEFETTLHQELQQYFAYLITMSEVELISRGRLEKEWAFTTKLANRVNYAAVLAPESFTEIVCNQLNRQLKTYQEKFNDLSKYASEIPEAKDSEATRQAVYVMCRETQSLYSSEREPCLQSAQFARTTAARLSKAPCNSFQACTDRIFKALMSIRDCITSQIKEIVNHSSMEEYCKDLSEGLQTRTRELLLQVFRFGFELHKELYKFVHTPIALREKEGPKQRPASLQPIRRQVVDERPKRPETVLFDDVDNLGLHKELHKVMTSTYQTNTEDARRPTLFRMDSQVDDDTYKIFENISSYSGQNQSSVDHLLSDAMSQNNDTVVTRRPVLSNPASNDQCEKVARAIIEFARFWMSFVMERCERGRGLRPRWASQGLEFLMLACDPQNTEHLSQTEFEILKRSMDVCISHVVGVRPPARAPPPVSPAMRHRTRRHSPGTPPPAPPAPPVAPAPHSAPPPPARPHPLLDFTLAPTTEHSTRVMSAIHRLERSVQSRLRDLNRVGRVVAGPVSLDGPLMRVTFKWLRGLRIGTGSFGKVYTVVNVESGQLLAMKEVSVGAGDRRALRRAAGELTILEGVLHPHLVRHYGCELHREEMLIFMELCVEGSLEELVVSAGALPEVQIRRYSRQLLSAVVELHHRKIAHRDIKSGNIFLTNEGNCLKLGDFGCAVKIRENHTAVGELMGYVGTQAYMAPEVFMKNTGHGRAADIWSLGCVVSEMATGKRPFAEYDSNYQIMFVVGMGGRPEIPESLSDEGTSFTTSCLTHEPELRPKADELMMHHFVRQLKQEEDCNCQTGYLISK